MGRGVAVPQTMVAQKGQAPLGRGDVTMPCLGSRRPIKGNFFSARHGFELAKAMSATRGSSDRNCAASRNVIGRDSEGQFGMRDHGRHAPRT